MEKRWKHKWWPAPRLNFDSDKHPNASDANRRILVRKDVTKSMGPVPKHRVVWNHRLPVFMFSLISSIHPVHRDTSAGKTNGPINESCTQIVFQYSVGILFSLLEFPALSTSSIVMSSWDNGDAGPTLTTGSSHDTIARLGCFNMFG